VSVVAEHLQRVEASLAEIEARPAEIRELLKGDEAIAEAYEICRRMERTMARQRAQRPAGVEAAE
jgi:hypothetical protein